MRVENRWKNLEPVAAVESLIARQTERLKRTIGRYDPEKGGVELQFHIEHNPKRELYEISGNLHLTNHQHLFAKEETHDLSNGVSSTFDELTRQVRKLKARLSANRTAGSEWPAENEEDDESEPEEVPLPSPEATDKSITRERLGRLARSIQRELRYHMALHDLKEDRIDPMAVLDDAIASALPRLGERTKDESVEVILIQEAMVSVSRRVSELLERDSREVISTEETLPSPDKRDRLEGATEAYLAPLVDENLSFEDLLPASGGEPDAVAETLEMEERIDRVLGTFPLVVRNAFLLSTLENLNDNQVAAALNIDEETLLTYLGQAREALHKELDPELSPAWRSKILGA